MILFQTATFKKIRITFLACAFVFAWGSVLAQQLSEEPAGGEEDSSIEAPSTLISSSLLPPEVNITPLRDWYPTWNNQYVKLYSDKFAYKGDSIHLILEPEGIGCFVPPVKGQFLSPFGYRGRRIHAGVDLKLNLYDTVVAAFPGVVRMARYFSGYGNCVVIRHFNGLETLYGHLSKISVSVNQKVNSGELVGLGGSTGRASCNHLHFETRFMGEAFNPKQLIDFDTYTLNRDTLLITQSVFGRSRDYLPSGKSFTTGNLASISKAAPSKAVKSKYHTIKSGDTLYSIANRNGTTVKKLCAINGIKQSKVLKPGTKLRVK
ncbi:MAG TPA: peptidoglycan DD-metalloendopeptidase family protein [Bacteroidales bacterium]|jgi:murein DD-endopeptidase MepM/ murein hydrolase activator NlpD|nr:peptidoglycan DD-metalloendopeptidase family protein [Bacteroidales bacterium]